jgi:SAM-dependent methyltransferase
MNDPKSLGAHIRSNPYLRERMMPEPGDYTYLHLADLRLALEQLRTESALSMLDYGCGGSPYRSLFPNADYKRADFLQKDGDTLDYILDKNSRVNEKGETFDFILSTQVLEHVDDPHGYIQECYRLLKKGGRLYITTHGSYPDHGCPYDYYRWTADGLARILQSVGFEICRVEKQTTGPRALFFQLGCHYHTLKAPRRKTFGMMLHIFGIVYLKLRPWSDKMCDRYFPGNRVVTDHLETHSSYIVTACLARKP